MSGISDKAIKSQYSENKYRYNGADELQNKEFSDGSGLEEYDANYRMYIILPNIQDQRARLLS